MTVGKYISHVTGDRLMSGPAWLFALRRGLHVLLPVVLVAIAGVVVGEYVRHVGEYWHHRLPIVERAVLGYFGVLVGVEFLLYDDKRQFLRDDWLDILLIVPFLTVFRLFGELAETVQGARMLAGLPGLGASGLTGSAGVGLFGVFDAENAALLSRDFREGAAAERTVGERGVGRIAGMLVRAPARVIGGGIGLAAHLPAVRSLGRLLLSVP